MAKGVSVSSAHYVQQCSQPIGKGVSCRGPTTGGNVSRGLTIASVFHSAGAASGLWIGRARRRHVDSLANVALSRHLSLDDNLCGMRQLRNVHTEVAWFFQLDWCYSQALCWCYFALMT